MKTLKKASKYHNCTVNDVVLALIACSLKQYLHVNGDRTTNSLNLLVPFSTREKPQSRKQFKMQNNFTILCFTLDLYNGFKQAL